MNEVLGAISFVRDAARAFPRRYCKGLGAAVREGGAGEVGFIVEAVAGAFTVVAVGGALEKVAFDEGAEGGDGAGEDDDVHFGAGGSVSEALGALLGGLRRIGLTRSK